GNSWCGRNTAFSQHVVNVEVRHVGETEHKEPNSQLLLIFASLSVSLCSYTSKTLVGVGFL
ncbi:hypothetical protein P3451_22810, partial [Vibrio parahaemolyticus]|nr:hypothetical protein [Vibrio parahaemolyticus]